jgi:hypothetical protein
MTPRQIDFWKNLLRPFHREAYRENPAKRDRSGKPLVWLDARAIRIRLLEELGPNGFRQEFRSSNSGDGMICRISILAPDAGDGFEWVHQEDVGGVENMGRNDRETGEWIEDADGNEKAAGTNSFRRAAAAFGFGIELYGSGWPDWLDHEMDAHPICGSGKPAARPAPSRPAHPPAQSAPANHGGNERSPIEAPTKPGKNVYRWIMAMGENYNHPFLKTAMDEAKRLGFGSRTDDWDQDQTLAIVGHCIEVAKNLDTYDDFFGPKPAKAPAPTPVAAPTPTTAPGTPDPEAAKRTELRRAIVAAASAILEGQSEGKAVTPPEIVACVGMLAAAVADGTGKRGQVLTSLKSCRDTVWLQNIVKEANRQISEIAAVRAAEADSSHTKKNGLKDISEDDDCPF